MKTAVDHSHESTQSDDASRAESDFIPCSIKMLPEEQRAAADETAVRINPGNRINAPQLARATDSVLPPAELAVLVSKRWPETGAHLTVGFMETVGATLRARIVSHMNAWGAYCNVTFSETSTKPQVRISLAGKGYWSYLGTDILHIDAGQPTMNLQGFSMNTPESEFIRVVRHETGHTLGFPHEHLRSDIVNKIDPAKAKAYFLASQGWDANKTTAQVLTPLDNSSLLATAQADPNSIMCYWLPASIMKNNVAVPGGSDIDGQDQAFAAVVYPKTGWSRWVPLGVPAGGFSGAPAVISRNGSVCNIYVRGADNALWQKAWFNNAWHDWARHNDGGVLASEPALGSMGPDHEHVFVRGTDNQVWQKWWKASDGWSHWVSLGGPAGGFVGLPAVVSRNGTVCNIYVRGADNALWQRAWFNNAWHDWTKHNDGGVLASEPALGSMGPDHEHVFVRGTDNQVWQKWWKASPGWSHWVALGAPVGGFVGAPAVVSRNGSVCNIYVRGVDNALWQRAWFNNAWHDWTRHNDGGVLASKPALGSMGPNHEHVFVRGADNQVWQKWWKG